MVVRLLQILPIILLAGLNFSPAIGEQSAQAETVINCSLKSGDGDVVEAVLTAAGDSIALKVNELKIIGVVPLRGHSHSPTIAVAGNMDARGVYTLAIHRNIFRPHPIGFDPDNPPATLTVQQADDNVVPTIKSYQGNCSFN